MENISFNQYVSLTEEVTFTLWYSDKGKIKYEDPKIYKSQFWINVMGMMGLYSLVGTYNTLMKQIFKQAKVNLSKVQENQLNDLTGSIYYAHKKKYINDIELKALGMMLAKIKQDDNFVIDENLLRKNLKRIYTSDMSGIPPKLVKIVNSWMKGSKSLKECIQALFLVSKQTSPQIGQVFFWQVIYLSQKKKQVGTLDLNNPAIKRMVSDKTLATMITNIRTYDPGSKVEIDPKDAVPIETKPEEKKSEEPAVSTPAPVVTQSTTTNFVDFIDSWEYVNRIASKLKLYYIIPYLVLNPDVDPKKLNKLFGLAPRNNSYSSTKYKATGLTSKDILEIVSKYSKPFELEDKKFDPIKIEINEDLINTVRTKLSLSYQDKLISDMYVAYVELNKFEDNQEEFNKFMKLGKFLDMNGGVLTNPFIQSERRNSLDNPGIVDKILERLKNSKIDLNKYSVRNQEWLWEVFGVYITKHIQYTESEINKVLDIAENYKNSIDNAFFIKNIFYIYDRKISEDFESLKLSQELIERLNEFPFSYVTRKQLSFKSSKITSTVLANLFISVGVFKENLEDQINAVNKLNNEIFNNLMDKTFHEFIEQKVSARHFDQLIETVRSKITDDKVKLFIKSKIVYLGANGNINSKSSDFFDEIDGLFLPILETFKDDKAFINELMERVNLYYDTESFTPSFLRINGFISKFVKLLDKGYNNDLIESIVMKLVGSRLLKTNSDFLSFYSSDNALFSLKGEDQLSSIAIKYIQNEEKNNKDRLGNRIVSIIKEYGYVTLDLLSVPSVTGEKMILDKALLKHFKSITPKMKLFLSQDRKVMTNSGKHMVGSDTEAYFYDNIIKLMDRTKEMNYDMVKGFFRTLNQFSSDLKRENLNSYPKQKEFLAKYADLIKSDKTAKQIYIQGITSYNNKDQYPELTTSEIIDSMIDVNMKTLSTPVHKISRMLENNDSWKIDVNDLGRLIDDTNFKDLMKATREQWDAESKMTVFEEIFKYKENDKFKKFIEEAVPKGSKNEQYLIPVLKTRSLADIAINSDMLSSGAIKPEGINPEMVLQALKFNGIQVKAPNKMKTENVLEYYEKLMSRKNDIIKNNALSDQMVEELEESEEELDYKSAAFFEYYSPGRTHGNIGLQFLKTYNSTLKYPEERKRWSENNPNTEMIVPAFHGSGSLAASFMTRYGFGITTGALIKAGRMLGNGIYVSNVVDKVAQYLGDASYGRKTGIIGYLFELDVHLGKEISDYNRYEDHEAGGFAYAGDPNWKFPGSKKPISGYSTRGVGTRSPEWCIFNPRGQIEFKKVHKVKLVSKSEIEEKYRSMSKEKITEAHDLYWKHLKPFKKFIMEAVEIQSKPGFTSYTFLDGTVPIDDRKTMEFEDFIDKYSNENIYLEYSPSGPMIVIRTDDPDEVERYSILNSATYTVDEKDEFGKFLARLRNAGADI